MPSDFDKGSDVWVGVPFGLWVAEYRTVVLAEELEGFGSAQTGETREREELGRRGVLTYGGGWWV